MKKHLIYQDIDANLSGIKRSILLFPAEAVVSFPDPDIANENVISLNGIAGTEDEYWIRVDVREPDGIMQYTTKETDDGKVYNYRVEGSVGLTDAEKDNFLLALGRREWIVACEDNNGELRVIGWAEGDEAHGMILEIEATTGKRTELNGYRLKFSMESSRQALPAIADIDIPQES